MSNIIPYDQKVDIHLDSLQTFVETFECLKNRYAQELYKSDDIDIHLLATVETQAAVNKAMLDLIEAMMEDAYPRARR